MASISYGEIASGLQGHTMLEPAGVIGPNFTPAVYNVSAGTIDHKHNRVDWVFDQYKAMKSWLEETGDPDRSSKGKCNLREKFREKSQDGSIKLWVPELKPLPEQSTPEEAEAVWMHNAEVGRRAAEEELEGKVQIPGCLVKQGQEVPCSSATYVDDGNMVTPDIPSARAVTAESYEETLMTALGDGSRSGQSVVSRKDVGEMNWEYIQTMLGHPAWFDRGFYMTSKAKWNILKVTSHKLCFDRGCKELQAGPVYSIFGICTWVALISQSFAAGVH